MLASFQAWGLIQITHLWMIQLKKVFCASRRYLLSMASACLQRLHLRPLQLQLYQLQAQPPQHSLRLLL